MERRSCSATILWLPSSLTAGATVARSSPRRGQTLTGTGALSFLVTPKCTTAACRTGWSETGGYLYPSPVKQSPLFISTATLLLPEVIPPEPEKKEKTHLFYYFVNFWPTFRRFLQPTPTILDQAKTSYMKALHPSSSGSLAPSLLRPCTPHLPVFQAVVLPGPVTSSRVQKTLLSAGYKIGSK